TSLGAGGGQNRAGDTDEHDFSRPRGPPGTGIQEIADSHTFGRREQAHSPASPTDILKAHRLPDCIALPAQGNAVNADIAVNGKRQTRSVFLPHQPASLLKVLITNHQSPITDYRLPISEYRIIAPRWGFLDQIPQSAIRNSHFFHCHSGEAR
ncbi:MAG TPA: hypothetical protein VHS80_17755, partial [Chthoniobacterales bacterium]|nr:hypothetical protein [Chthoniobacterales bacterium]